MKPLILIVFILLISATAAPAAPWLACDPYPQTETQPQYFYFTLDTAAPIKCTHTVDPNGWKIYDLSAIPIGNHTSSLRACINDPQWGEVCSDPTPFAFTRPGPLLSPTNIKLLK